MQKPTIICISAPYEAKWAHCLHCQYFLVHEQFTDQLVTLPAMRLQILLVQGLLIIAIIASGKRSYVIERTSTMGYYLHNSQE